MFKSFGSFENTFYVILFAFILASTLGVIRVSVDYNFGKRKIVNKKSYMANKTRDVINYIVKHYPFPDDLTIIRITQLIYLIDWEMAKRYHGQLTDSKWYLDGSNIQSLSIAEEINNDENITVIKQQSNFGTIKFILQAKNSKESLSYNSLTNEEIVIIDEVIEDTKTKQWLDFRSHVRSTKPITNGVKYDYLDLISFVK